MGLFNGLAKAKIFQQGKFFREGRFIVMVQKVGHGDTRNSKEKFFVEFKIIGCLSPNATLAIGKAATAVAAQPGDMATDMTTANKESFWSNVKEMLLGLTRAKLGSDVTEESIPEDQWEPMAEAAVSAEQPYAGTFLEFTATPITTQKGNPFTRKHYGQGLSAQQVREVLAELVRQGDKRHEEKLLFPNGELQKMIDEEIKASQAA